MIRLITELDVYAPHPLGINDVLMAGDKILAIAPNIILSGAHVERIDGRGRLAIPGLVDSLVHITGGGGEGSFHTRTPEMMLTQASLAGVTTVIGALGTDATTRSLADLVAKARALDHEGISAYCYTGSYQVPVRTLTGSITDDIVLIDKMIGVGEVAIADHRGSQPSVAELARIAAEAKVGGLLSGKGGIVYIHTGEEAEQLQMLHAVIEQYAVKPRQFYPTHINRNQRLVDAGIQWTRAGGIIDMTTSTNAQFIAEGEIEAAEAIAYCVRKGVSPLSLSMSSDGNASLPVFNAAGELIGLEVGQVASLYQSLQALVLQHRLPLATALATVTESPATALRLTQKGRLAPDMDADLVLCEPDTLAIDTVFARGRCLVEGGRARVKGTFE